MAVDVTIAAPGGACDDIPMKTWIPWAIAGAALLHVVEEYATGWLTWARGFAPSITLGHFSVVNAAFLALCVLAGVLGAALMTLPFVLQTIRARRRGG